MSARRQLTAIVVTLTVSALGMSACGGSNKSSSPSPTSSINLAKVLVNDAQQHLNDAPAAHFKLSSQNVPNGVTTVTKGEGDLARPDKFAGQLFVQGGLFNGSVQTRAIGNKVWAQLPIVGWHTIDPATYGVPNPANLIDKQSGVSAWLGDLQNRTLNGQHRTNGQVTYEVDGQVPGKDVAKLLPDADSSQPMQAQLFITDSGHLLSEVILTGPFYAKQKQSSYTLDLSKYGENVSISAP